ncbi:UNVERIFIED_CONTAM: YtxH domain-containing protein, partial [Lactobacillus paragasseri]|nr:YtxH domain-containing protein [Lactobacillus paragasseri]
ETAPRVDAIQKHVENINDAVSNLDAMPTADQREPLPKH